MQRRKINLEGLGMAYTPKSKAKSLKVDTPDSMGYEINKALQDLQNDIGDVDEYVRSALRYKTKEQLYDALFAEQIDVVALNIYNIEKKHQGIIIADQTGIGKGRCAAAMIRYAVNQGLKPIFITEKDNLFSDIYRDLKGIGSGNLVPYIVNAQQTSTDVKDENGRVIYRALTETEQKSIVDSKRLPSRFDYVMLTYTQINKEGFNPKTEFIRAIGKGTNFILDESHNASGTSNTGKTLSSIIGDANGVTFLSATFAKRPDNMGLYAAKTCMKEANLGPEEFAEAITAGGVALQEVVASQLVSQGQMVRRERTFEGIEVNYITLNELAKPHQEISDNITEIIRDIIDFQERYVKDEVSYLDGIYREKQGQIGTNPSIGANCTSVFSVVHNIVGQMLFAIKADAVADRAILRLKEGKKPVIAFSSTMGSFLEKLEDENFEPVKIGSVVKADFAAVLMSALDNVLRYRIKKMNGDVERMRFDLSELNPKARADYQKIKAKIQVKSTGILVSPIDYIKQKIAKAGYKVSEVTGRKMALELSQRVARPTTVNEISEKRIELSDKAYSFMPSFQSKVLMENYDADVIERLNKQIAEIPALYHYENLLQQLRKTDKSVKSSQITIAHAHFFFADSDWYITEWNGEDELYGYTILNGDMQNAEFGYMSLSEIRDFRQGQNQGIELDCYWTPRSISDIKKMKYDGLSGKKRKRLKGLGDKLVPKIDTELEWIGTVIPRPKEYTNDAFREFNNNKADVLLINQSGATGASAHAIVTDLVPKDKVKQRVMIVLQAEYDISTEVQKRGRINRTGQILLPIYDYLISAIPAEKRLMMMLQKKLKSLDANTTANQKNSEALIKSDDFLNKYGDKVVEQYLFADSTGLNERLGDPLGVEKTTSEDWRAAAKKKKKGTVKEEDTTAGKQEGLAQKTSGRVAVLDVAEQETFYTEVLQNYQDYVAMLIEEDKYDLEVETQNLRARAISKNYLKAGKGGVSPFGDSTFIEKCEVDVLKKPLTPTELEKAIKDSLDGQKHQEITKKLLADLVNHNEAERLKEIDKAVLYNKQKIENIEGGKAYESIKTKEGKVNFVKDRTNDLKERLTENLKNINEEFSTELKFLYDLFEYFSVGRKLKVPDTFAPTDVAMGVCLGFTVDLSKPRPFSPGRIKLRIAVANSKRIINFNGLSGENAQRILAIKGSSPSFYDYTMPMLLQDWANNIASASKSRTERFIITGNLIQAFSIDELPRGKLIQYTTQNGRVLKGVLMPVSFKNIADKGLQKVTVPIGKILPIVQRLTKDGFIDGSNTVAILRNNEMPGFYKLATSISKEKAGNIFLDEDILKLVKGKNFQSVSTSMVADVDYNNMQAVLNILENKHNVEVELSQADFALIEHQFQENKFENEVIAVPTPTPIVDVDVDKKKKLALKYKYRLRLQLQEQELNQA